MTLFVGWTPRGPLDRAVRPQSLEHLDDEFGTLKPAEFVVITLHVVARTP